MPLFQPQTIKLLLKISKEISNNTTSGVKNKKSEKCIRPRLPIIYGESLVDQVHKISESNDEYNLKI